MKNIFLAVILCLCASNAVAQLNLSVQECREMAVATSQDIGIAELEYEQAVLDRKIARTGYLPNLSGSGTFAHLTEKMEMSMMGMPMEMNMQAVYMAGLNIQQPIFAGGKIIAGNRMATTAVEIRDENRRLVRANTIADAVQAYWTYVSVMDKVELLEQYARHLETIFNSVETSVAVQMATDNDLLKVSARKSNIEYQLQKARNGLELSRMALCKVIGVPLDTAIIPTDKEISAGSPHDPGGFDLTLRPEYSMLSKQIAIHDNNIRSVRADFLPTLGVSVGYTYFGGLKFAGSEIKMSTPMVMASLSIPIFHFGEGYKKVKQAKLARQVSYLELEKTSILLEIDQNSSERNLRDAEMLVRTSENALRQTEADLATTQSRYELQMATLLDLLDAQTQWQEAYSNHIEAKANYKITEVGYLKASGQLE